MSRRAAPRRLSTKQRRSNIDYIRLRSVSPGLRIVFRASLRRRLRPTRRDAAVTKIITSDQLIKHRRQFFARGGSLFVNNETECALNESNLTVAVAQGKKPLDMFTGLSDLGILKYRL